MKVHHLNCGTMYPLGCGELVCHVLHCGDAFFHHGTVDGTARMPRALAAFESVTAFDRKMMQENHARLIELYRRREPDMLMVCSHDRTLYEQANATA